MKPHAESYASWSPYAFANNPILFNDPDGLDWNITTTTDKNGKSTINITYITAVMNSSGKDINMKGYMASEQKKFQQTFGGQGINAKMEIRQINSLDNLKSNERFIIPHKMLLFGRLIEVG